MTTDNALSTPTLADLADRMDAWSIAGLRALDSGPQWLPMSTVAVTAAYTFGPFDRVVFANAAGGAFTVTLPNATNRRNQQALTVIRTNSGANNVTIASLGGTINGAATVTITLQYDSHTFLSDGTNWWITTDALTGSAPTGNAGGDLSGTYPNPGVVQAAKLTTARTINAVSFDGSANIIVTAAAGTLTGAALAAGVTASSLTSLGTLTGLALSGKVTTYNNVATAGQGLETVVAHGYIAGVVNAAQASVCTFTPAADGFFRIGAYLNLTASVTNSFTMTCTYTDEGGSARTQTIPFIQIAGTPLTLVTAITGVGPYEGMTFTIRAKGSTAITLQTAPGGTYTSVSYNVEGSITQVG